MKPYDYLIVGAGLFGATFAQRAKEAGKRCVVIDRRAHVGGNAYTEKIEGIDVHRYGAHIFHTSDERVWKYVNRFSSFNHYVNSPIADYHGEIYNLPFNMNTFSRMWNISTPAQAKAILDEQCAPYRDAAPQNLEEQALSMVGRDLYEKLVKGYTEKQWGRPCAELPPDILKRLPVRFTYDNNYFGDPWQGIPADGYTAMVERMLEGIDVRLNEDFLEDRETYRAMADRIVYTGSFDRLYGYRYGALSYRSLRFDTRVLDTPNAQGNAVINYTAADVPYTRVIEHKHFAFGKQEKTVLTYEYSDEWTKDKEPFYPIDNAQNRALYAKYARLAEQDGILPGGRLGLYRYLDMDKVVAAALNMADAFL